MSDHAHLARADKQKDLKQQIQERAFSIAQKTLQAHQLNESSDTTELYQTIDDELNHHFPTFNQYRIARQGFLQAVRDFNKSSELQLDEPVVPIVEGRDKLTISYDWFVEGSKVSDSFDVMLGIWQNKRKFPANDKVKYLLYSSIMMGGLCDIEALKALYDWLFGERKLYQINLSELDERQRPFVVIPLEVDDERYGCTHQDESHLIRYVNYVPDPVSLMFLYALKDIDINKRKISPFETLINQLSNQLNLTQRDRDKPHLSHLVKYANFHWRNLPESAIDESGSLVMQSDVKTTALPFNKLINYNKEIVNNKSSYTAFRWDLLFTYQTPHIKQPHKLKHYPAFSKNVIKSIQDALKQSKPKAIEDIPQLLTTFPQPNASRLIEWTLSLLEDGKSNQQSISKYIGSIGRDWLMLTMDEDLSLWESHDYAEVYEQILQQKCNDGRKPSVLYQEDSDDIDPELNDEDIEALAELGNKNDDASLEEGFDVTYKESENDDVSDGKVILPKNKTFIKGRLYAFHEFQKRRYKDDYDAPDLSFGRKDSLQIVKANMISPKVYWAMQSQLNNAPLSEEQKQLCLSIITLAYRTGMRLNELAGIQVKDIEDSTHSETINIVLTPNRYRRLKSSSARRRILITPLFKPVELDKFKQLIARQRRAGRTYLFSQGVGNYPLPSHVFVNLLRILLDLTLGENNHDYTFHSFRHTAISQLALVVNKSPLTYTMTDYTADDVDAICQALLGRHQIQGAWFGLASFVGHLTCNTTFEHYVHTAHLLAGEQLSQAKIRMPLTTWQNITGLDYQRVNYFDKTAYDKNTKTVDLNSLSIYLARKLHAHHHLLFADNNKKLNSPSVRAQSQKNDDPVKKSIFIHAKYNDAISFLFNLDEISPENREKHVEKIGVKHGIYSDEARQIFANAKRLNNNDKLIIKPKGQNTNDLISLAMDRAYQMSIKQPDKLKKFVEIYQQKHITSNAYLHFGIKENQKELLAEFMNIACQIIDAQHWQIRSDKKQAVRDLKNKHNLNSQIMTGTRPNFKGFEVRVVMRAERAETEETDYRSSGVLKFVGGLLVCLVGLGDTDGTTKSK